LLTQKNQSARVTAHYTSGGIAKPGLSPTVDVYDSSGLILSGQASTEVGGGFYDYVLPSGSTPNAGNYKFLFKTTDTSVDQRHVPGLWIIGEQWVENVNATVSSRSSHSAADIWAVGTRTLTGFGTLVADIATAVWGAATRTLSAFGFNVTVATNNDKTGYALTPAYDPAKTAAQGVDMVEVLATVEAIDGTTSLIDGKVDTLQTSVNGLNDISQAEVYSQVSTAIAAATLATGADVDALQNDIMAILDGANGVDPGITVRQALRACLSALAGTNTGAGTTNIEYKSTDGSKTRISATVDSVGNRSNVVLDVT